MDEEVVYAILRYFNARLTHRVGRAFKGVWGVRERRVYMWLK